MDTALLGLHHVTAIVDDPQQNIDFYAEVLGLRLVKQTVNFDDPYTYHLYYGDDLGRPGTIVTFFPWPGARRGSRGTGQISAFAFTLPQGSAAFWAERLTALGQRFGGPQQRFGAPVLSLYDPAGLLVELIEQPCAGDRPGRTDRPVPSEHAIRGLFGVTLTVAQPQPTEALLRDVLGFRPAGAEGGYTRYLLGQGEDAAALDLLARPDVPRGVIAVGSTHHVAWRVADDAAQQAWLEELGRRGVGVTPVQDRKYFRSIYFREPGGVLFEIATDPPGFAVDEAPGQLGASLMLPPWLEPMRADIQRHLLPLRPPAHVAA